MSRQTTERKRITLYASQSDRRELLEWAKKLTNAPSDSEAIFQALEMLRTQVQKTLKKRGAATLASSKGLWSNDAKIAKAFDKIGEGWDDWNASS